MNIEISKTNTIVIKDKNDKVIISFTPLGISKTKIGDNTIITIHTK